MTRLQFWILNVICWLISILFIFQIIVARKYRVESEQLTKMEFLLREGDACQVLYNRLASRTYQIGANDPDLRNILLRQGLAAPSLDNSLSPSGAANN